MKRIWTAAMVLSALGMVACGASDEAALFSDNGGPQNAGKRASGDSESAGAPTGGSAAPATPGATPAAPSESTTETPGAQSGVLTAGVWDDNLNFDFYKKYVELSGDAASNGLPSFSLTERDQARAQWMGPRGAKTELDVAFVIDTTGSMGDELKYIQTEIDGIAQAIKDRHPQMAARYSLVLYRDQGDAYLTRPFDFGDLATFKANVNAQSVGGGGDYPEGVVDGLAETMKLSWRTGSVARMAFWIADAPHHHGEEDLVKASIAAAAAKDVHIYPVAASGSDDRTEFTMRTAAQMTGGRYVFLTDDSGVGGAHAEPKIPCYHVTRFDGALVRMVESELAGQHIAPESAQILRSVGNPQNGQCATTSSGNVSIY